MNEFVSLARPERWVEQDDTAVRGTAFVDGDPVDAAALAGRVAAVDTATAFRRTVERLDGFYAVVRVVDGTVYAATDHVRSVPLFYAPDLGLVSDSARLLRERLGTPAVDGVAEAEYLTATYVTGDETLYRGIRTLRAGELLELDTTTPVEATGRVRTEHHWTYSPGAAPDAPEATTGERLATLDDAMVTAFERCLAVADGRPIAVPLSGGYDSRLVAAMLVRLGAEDVRTFTYGQAGSADVRVAEDVADALDLPWRHVEYTADDWFEWFNSADRAAYYERADDFDAIPNLSAWPAVRRLRDEGWLPADSVVVPGQTVAGIAGHLPRSLLVADATVADAVDAVLDQHYVQWAHDDELERAFRTRVRGVVDGVCEPEDPTSVYSAWEWQERQAKFLCSDGRIYEDCGLDWWFPLWDPMVAAAWGALPVDDRLDKRHYTEYVETLYADVADVGRDAAERNQVTDSRVTATVTRVRSALARSPLAGVLRPVYRRYRTRTDTRASGQLGHLGMLSPEQFDRLYTAGRSHHAFRALEAVGRVSFAPAHEDGWPGEVLSVDGLDRTRPATNRGVAGRSTSDPPTELAESDD
ncbi:asparagine synthase C-terminal domain-containing protein [Halomarina oriensis]|uniref:Asparagine synthetase domain-containing protein n=1 Tax=Halomarina oriensis TaxID=671145 RepID=A0A6B0GRE5_9EURY|nr:asparagine synthase C-terminal domain-containing protein [Halomarina oriensis]MWG34248.1 hypothetical protein [Halomarina oriensis]